MGRRIRRVARDWRHPRDETGRLIPLRDGAAYPALVEQWDVGAKKWAEGLYLAFDGKWVPFDEDQQGLSYEAWAGLRPDPANFMPLWCEDERTHVMLYETTTEGTPISPAFGTCEELATWIIANAAGNVWHGVVVTSIESVRDFIACSLTTPDPAA